MTNRCSNTVTNRASTTATEFCTKISKKKISLVIVIASVRFSRRITHHKSSFDDGCEAAKVRRKMSKCDRREVNPDSRFAFSDFLNFQWRRANPINTITRAIMLCLCGPRIQIARVVSTYLCDDSCDSRDNWWNVPPTDRILSHKIIPEVCHISCIPIPLIYHLEPKQDTYSTWSIIKASKLLSFLFILSKILFWLKI